MSAEESIKDSLKYLQSKGIVLPDKPGEAQDDYKRIPYNLGEINIAELGTYLSVWTKYVNWSGYNLAALKTMVDYKKTLLSRAKSVAYMAVKSNEGGSIKDIENAVNHREEIIAIEDELFEIQTKVNMLTSIHESNSRNVSLISREITRRSNVPEDTGKFRDKEAFYDGKEF